MGKSALLYLVLTLPPSLSLSVSNAEKSLADLLLLPKCSKYLRSINSNRFVVPRIKTKTWVKSFLYISSSLMEHPACANTYMPKQF